MENQQLRAPLGHAPFIISEESDNPPPTAHGSLNGTSAASAIAAYALALVLGVGITLYFLPLHVMFAADSLSHPVPGMDATMNAIGQRYFVADSWRWQVLVAKPLVTPDGTNIAFTDSIPLIAIPMKLFRHFLPPGFHTIFLWLALCWVAQPVAAIFALRSTGERRLVPGLAVALIAVSMPTLLVRFGHSSLCSHFVILIAVGLYFRIARCARPGLIVLADVLMVVALLITPYMMYMVIAVLAAAPLTLLIRGDRSWIKATSGIVAGVAVTGVVALILGYGRALPVLGFGYYSMNLLSPFYPWGSSFFPGLVTPMDATGGQYEGYQYLGIGVLLLLCFACFCAGIRNGITLIRRHGGLVLACIGLTILSFSTRVYAGHHLLLALPTPAWLLQFRTTGRLFWPVAYAAVIIGTAMVCRFLSRRMLVAVLLLAVSLQFIEASTLRKRLRQAFRNPQPWVLDTAALRPLLSAHTKLTVWPKFLCGADPRSAPLMQTFLLASEVAIPVNTTYTGRYITLPKCDAPTKVDAKELLVFMPSAPSALVTSVEDWRNICHQVGALTVCSQELRSNEPRH